MFGKSGLNLWNPWRPDGSSNLAPLKLVWRAVRMGELGLCTWARMKLAYNIKQNKQCRRNTHRVLPLSYTQTMQNHVICYLGIGTDILEVTKWLEMTNFNFGQWWLCSKKEIWVRKGNLAQKLEVFYFWSWMEATQALIILFCIPSSVPQLFPS